MAAPVTTADVIKLTAPTKGFLCPLSANTFGIDFLAFKIRDTDTNKTLFEVAKDPNAGPIEYPPNFDYDQLRHISYKFPADFLKCKTIGTTLTFKVGNKPVRNFQMIERHYFKEKLIQSYDFNFKFCIPDSTNEWEAIYPMPQLTAAEAADMIASPEQTRSDSFYFVEGALIMHNKATYSYVSDDPPAAKQKEAPAAAAAAAAPAAAAGGAAAAAAPASAAAAAAGAQPAAAAAAAAASSSSSAGAAKSAPNTKK